MTTLLERNVVGGGECGLRLRLGRRRGLASDALLLRAHLVATARCSAEVPHRPAVLGGLLGRLGTLELPCVVLLVELGGAGDELVADLGGVGGAVVDLASERAFANPAIAV